jgi:ADP-glucose pyrophosphorylase
MDYGPMIACHVENRADVTVGCVVVPPSEASAFGVFSTKSSQLRMAAVAKTYRYLDENEIAAAKPKAKAGARKK